MGDGEVLDRVTSEQVRISEQPSRHPSRQWIRQRIDSGQKELSKIRYRFGAVLLFLAALSGFVHDWIYYFALRRSKTHACEESVTLMIEEVLLSTLAYCRIIFPALAPLANDRCFTRLALVIDSVSLLFYDCLYLYVYKPTMNDFLHHLSIYFAPDVGFVLGAMYAFSRTSASIMKKCMWRNLQIWIFLNVPLSVLDAVTKTRRCHRPKGWLWVFCQLVLFALIYWPPARHKARKYLGHILVTKSANRAAASIAGLVGACSAREVLLEAQARFKSLRLADLPVATLLSNAPDPSLAWITMPTRLGLCDAFVSHSWHDDAASKWTAMQCWREAFCKEKGREPTIWFDKCCIDQASIERDLRCLPVFLSGCKRLVVFAGTTYLTRLWCVIELFTFVHMGGCLTNVQFIPVVRPDHEVEDLKAIRFSFTNFDVRNCTCFLQEDKGRMLSIITAIYGELDEFNKAVRPIFRRARRIHGGICMMGSESNPNPEAGEKESESDSEESSEASLSPNGSDSDSASFTLSSSERSRDAITRVRTCMSLASLSSF